MFYIYIYIYVYTSIYIYIERERKREREREIEITQSQLSRAWADGPGLGLLHKPGLVAAGAVRNLMLDTVGFLIKHIEINRAMFTDNVGHL